jgi:2-keto-4-pentenoate hydratase/2-oxohepta-3-ene-1,7-dioic acid hydratase in catechol pathway
MRIIRFITAKGAAAIGAVDAPDDRKARLIEGDIFGHFKLTRETASIEELMAPVQPPNILCLGLNYRRHAEETGTAFPEGPVLFLKATTSIAGPGDPIVLPAAGPDEVDFEVELAIVIGKRTKNVPPGQAMERVLGYTCANDVSARDWQIRKQKKQWARGKSFDTFCPVGPWIVTADEIRNPDNLRLRTLVSGETLQDSNTADMIFDCARIVSDLSRSMTLLPGTLILTGTPEGVGFTRRPPRFLRDGDRVSVIIEGIGELSNPVTLERVD